jgi:HK97 gp10 family phage protein
VIGIRAWLSGVPKLVRKLAELDKKVCKKALRDGVNEATKPILKDARARVPVDTKLLKKALGRKVVSYRVGLSVVGIVGVRKHMEGKKGQRKRGSKWRVKVGTDSAGKPVYMDPIKYAHLVEFGTRPHAIAKGDRLARKGRKGKKVQLGGRHPGTKPHPFLRPAMDGGRRAAVATVKRFLQAAIEAAAEK